MAYAFRRAPTIEPGDPVTSSQLAKLAGSFNDRLRSGLGDMAWRIVFQRLKLFTAMRNPDASGFLWPAQAEFFEAYQMLELLSGTWPVTGPGEPEGANVSNPVCLYVWGNESAGIYDESGRLSEVPLVLPSTGMPPATVSEIRMLGKLQRGAADLVSGVAVAPAWAAGRSWSQIRHDWYRSPHGSTYGGWQAAPDLQSPPCEDPDPYDEAPAPPNYAIKFTPTAAGEAVGLAVKTYAGTCQIGPGVVSDYSLHVAAVVNSPWAYYVILNNGTVDVLPRNYYVEGPYYGAPRLRKTEGQQLINALSQFASEFRGPDQNAAAISALHQGASVKPSRWLVDAFDCQEFFSRQYVLAPARGRKVDGGVEALYPEFRLDVADPLLPAGTVVPNHPSGTSSFEVTHGHVACGGWARANALSAPCILEVVAGTTAVANVTLTPESPETIFPFRADVPAGQSITIRTARETQFSAPSAVEAEIDELVEYKPELSDWVLVCRLSSGG